MRAALYVCKTVRICTLSLASPVLRAWHIFQRFTLYRAASISFTSSIRFSLSAAIVISAPRESSLLKDTLFRKGSRWNLVSVSDVL